MSQEEEEKAIKSLKEFANTTYGAMTAKEAKTVLNLIETKKAEIEKKDKMIDKMAENLTSPIYNKKEVIEYFTRLVEGEKENGRE